MIGLGEDRPALEWLFEFHEFTRFENKDPAWQLLTDWSLLVLTGKEKETPLTARNVAPKLAEWLEKNRARLPEQFK
ncbi:MAG: hypothetical protein ACAI25_13605 [Planctomycetota bacterium]